MLYHLLTPELVGVTLFQYQTFRAALAAITAFVFSLIVGPLLIAWLKSHGLEEDVAKTDSAELAELREIKRNTPTMGGLMIIGVVVLSSLLWARLDEPYVLGAAGLLLALGAIGMRDDWIKLTRADRHGLSARWKLGGIVLVAAMVAVGLYFRLTSGGSSELLQLQLPFIKDVKIDLSVAFGLGYLALVGLVVVSSANAVNLTDGMDGLAIGCVTLAAMTLAVYSYVAGHVGFAKYLNLTHVPGAGELSIVCGALIGGGLGFLWYNCFPAQIFMGDTGSLPLGGVLGYVAVVTRQELMLVLIGGIFVAEALSVILQVGSFKTTGRRIFRCAPLHHHFEFGAKPRYGYLAEAKVTVRFWIVAAIMAMVGVASLKLR